MFPKTSFVMMLIAGLLLIIATIVNFYSGNPINKLYLGIGILFAIYGAAMLFSRRKK